MIMNAFEYLSGGFYDGSVECYTIHYRTWKQSKSKFRAFTTLDEAVNWAKRQRGKIIPDSGSWQILKILDGVDIYAEADDTAALDDIPVCYR